MRYFSYFVLALVVLSCSEQKEKNVLDNKLVEDAELLSNNGHMWKANPGIARHMHHIDSILTQYKGTIPEEYMGLGYVLSIQTDSIEVHNKIVGEGYEQFQRVFQTILTNVEKLQNSQSSAEGKTAVMAIRKRLDIYKKYFYTEN